MLSLEHIGFLIIEDAHHLYIKLSITTRAYMYTEHAELLVKGFPSSILDGR